MHLSIVVTRGEGGREGGYTRCRSALVIIITEYERVVNIERESERDSCAASLQAIA